MSTTPTEPNAAPAGPDHLPAGSLAELSAARLGLLSEARRRVDIQLPRLTSELYSSTEELAELRRIAISGRGAEIRILLHEPAAALRDDHRLIALIQRLPSVVHVRTPQEEHDLALSAAWLLTDAGGYLYQPDAGASHGRAARHDRAAQAPLQQLFDERWERAQPAAMLYALGI